MLNKSIVVMLFVLCAVPAAGQSMSDRSEKLAQSIAWGSNMLDLGTHHWNYRTVWCSAERPTGCLYEGNPVMQGSERRLWALKFAGTAAQSYLVHFAHKKAGWKAGLAVAVMSSIVPTVVGIQNIHKGQKLRSQQ